VNFFFDNMMSPKLVDAINILFGIGHVITHIKRDARFSDNTRDIVWMSALAKDPGPWSIISGDMKMLNNPTIISDLHSSNNRFFCMDDAWCNTNSEHAQSWKLMKVWPEIVAHSATPGPIFFEIQTTGSPRVRELRLGKRARRPRG
jgi:PIN like domain